MSAPLKTYIQGPLLPLITAIVTENSTRIATSPAEIAAQRAELAARLADAISTAVAVGVQTYLTADVRVTPGQAVTVATVGGPTSQAGGGSTVSPGILLAP